MKPASFRYFAPRSVDDALNLLAAHGEEGKILAGGQSRVAAMNFCLARATSLIDINRIEALDYVREDGVSCALARWPGTLVSKRPLPVVRSPRFCRGGRGTLGIFRSDFGALSVEASLTPIRPPNGAWWPPHSMPSSSLSAAAGSTASDRANILSPRSRRPWNRTSS